MASDSTRRITIEVDVSGGQTSLRQIKDVREEADKLNTSQDHSIRIQKDLTNANVNTSKKFADQQQTMSGLVRTYAITAANVFALSAAYNVLRENANLEIMVKASEQLSKSTGINFSNVGKSIREISQGALGVKESMQAATLGISGGASVEQLERITAVATKAATALGRSVPDSITRMIQAVTKGEPELVDEFGIILRLTTATDEYARSVHKTSAELNTMEKQQAILQQLLKQGESKFKDVDLKENINEYDRLAASTQEILQKLLTIVSGPIASIFSTLTQHSGLLYVTIGLIASSLVKAVIPSFHEMGKSFGESSNKIISSSIDARRELATYYAFTNTKLNEQRNKYLSNTEAFKAAQATLKTTLPDVAGIAMAKTPGHALTFAQSSIDTKDIGRQIEAIGDSNKKVSIAIGDTVSMVTKESAKKIVDTLTFTRGIAEKEVKSMTDAIGGYWVSFKNKLNIISQEIHGTVGKVAGVGASISGVVGAAFSGQTLAGGKTAVRDFHKARLIEVDAAIEDGTASIKHFSGAWATASNVIIAGAGKAALAVRGIGMAMNFILGPIAILSTLFVVFSELVDWLELIPKKSKEASSTLDALTDDFEHLEKSVQDATDKLQLNAHTMADLVSKYELLGNKTREINEKISKGLAALQDIGGGKFQNSIGMKLLGLDGGTKQIEALKSIIAHVGQLEKLTGKPIDLKVNIQGIEMNLKDSLDKLSSLNPEDRLAVDQKVTYEIEKRNREIIDTEGSVKDLNSAVTNLNKSWQDQTTQFRRANPLSMQIESMETLIRTYDKFKKAGKGIEAELSIVEGLDPGKAKSIGLDTSKIEELKTLDTIRNFLKEIKTEGQTPVTQFQLFKQMIADGKLSLNNLTQIESILKTINSMGAVRPEVLKLLEKETADKLANIGDSGNSEKAQAALDMDKAQLNKELTVQSKLAELTEREKLQSSKAARGDLTELTKSLITKREILNVEKESAELSIATKEANIKGLTDPFAISQQVSEIEKLKASIKSITEEQTKYSDSVISSTHTIALYKQKLEPIKQDIEQLSNMLSELENQQKSRPETKDTEGLESIRVLNAEIDRNTEHKLRLEKLILKEEQAIAESTQNRLGLETSSLAILKLEGEEKKEQGKAIQNSINLLKEELAIKDLNIAKSEQVASKSEKELSLVSSISSNDKFDPTFRAKTLTIENKLMQDNLRIQLESIDNYIEEKESLTDIQKQLLGNAEVQKISEDLDSKKLERESLLVAYSIQKLDNAKKQNEIDKLLVDKGLKDFNTTFKTSMAIAAQDFSKSLGTSVDRAVKQIIGTIDATLDTTFSNAQAFLSGAKSGKEAIADIQEDLSKFFIDSAVNDAKNSLKEVFLHAIGGEANQFATPQEKTNDWLEKIYEKMGGTSLSSAGIEPGSSKGVGGSLFSGIKDFFGKAGTVLSDAAGGIGDFFSNIKWHAAGGIITEPSIIGAGEAGTEAIIPLSGGAVPVVLSGMQGGSIESTKALIAVSQKMRDIVGNGDEQIAALQGTNIAINTMSKEIVNQLIIGTAQIVNSLSGVGQKTGWNSIAAGLMAVSSLVGAAAGAYSSAPSGSGSDTAVASDYGSFSGGTSDAAYADGGVIDRPTRALMGEGRNSEAVVPLPNNRSIPVQFQGKNNMASDHPINISVNVVGVRDEGGLNRSDNQIALESARAAQRALRRDG